MEKMSFMELTQLWKDNCLVRKSIEVATKEGYLKLLENRILPALGDMDICSIDGLVLDGFVGKLIDCGYSSKSIKNTVSVIREIFKFAYRKDFIASNPIEKMEPLPTVSKSNAIHYFTPRQARLFLDELNKENILYKTIFYLLLFSGCRRGEVCALRWDDVDFGARTICIRRAVSYTREGLVIKTPKTRAGYRTISLPDECLRLLAELRGDGVCCSDGACGIHAEPAPAGYVFRDHLGRYEFLPPQRVTDMFRWIIDRHNNSCAAGDELPSIRLHDLRHTAATLLVSSNVDVETVARRLGHANPSITLNIYAHPTMEADYRASAVLSQLIG